MNLVGHVALTFYHLSWPLNSMGEMRVRRAIMRNVWIHKAWGISAKKTHCDRYKQGFVVQIKLHVCAHIACMCVCVRACVKRLTRRTSSTTRRSLHCTNKEQGHWALLGKLSAAKLCLGMGSEVSTSCTCWSAMGVCGRSLGTYGAPGRLSRSWWPLFFVLFLFFLYEPSSCFTVKSDQNDRTT